MDNKFKKAFTAVVCEIQEKEMLSTREKYGKYLLKCGKSKITALAYADTYSIVKNVLQLDETIKFPPKTFSSKPRNKNFNSNATYKDDLIFLRGSAFIEKVKFTLGSPMLDDTDSVSSSLQKVIQLAGTSETFTRTLKSIRFTGGAVYRYWGCEICSFSIRTKHSDGKYYCKGMCNNLRKNKKKRRSPLGVATERKICVTINDVILSDDNNEAIDSVVIYNSACELLSKKCGSDFNTDNDAISSWKELITNFLFNITLKRNKKKKDSVHPPAVFVGEIDAQIAVRLQAPQPDFPEVEIKLQRRSEKPKDFIPNYHINSKPHGIVLLINNYNFPNDKRKGSEIDVDLLEKAFIEMGYEIYGSKCHSDIKTKKEFGDLIEDFKKELIAKNVDSCFIIISSHGRNNEVFLVNDTESLCVVNDLMNPFSDKRFPEFQGKPKVFMPITCQELGTRESENEMEIRCNHLFDVLICCPCLPGYVQFRYLEHGSLFVRLLIDNLMKYALSADLVEILKKVATDIRDQISNHGLVDITVPHCIGSTFGKFFLVPTADVNSENTNPFRTFQQQFPTSGASDVNTNPFGNMVFQRQP